VAWILDNGLAEAVPMPQTDQDLLRLLHDLRHQDACFAVLERVSASPQMGVVSAFSFGWHFGALQMALAAVGIPYDLVTPQVWQRALSCLSHGDKTITKRRAQQLFPMLHVTHATADALLLAEHGRRLRARTYGEDDDSIAPSRRARAPRHPPRPQPADAAPGPGPAGDGGPPDQAPR
jgi:hypothetical protein